MTHTTPAASPAPPPSTAPASLRRRLPRRPLAWIGLLLLLLVLAFAACEWAGWPFLRGPIQRALQQRLQRDVLIGEDFRLSLLGGIRLKSDAFALGAPAWAAARGHAEPLVQAEGVLLALPYATVLAPLRQTPGAEVHVKALEVRRMTASLWRAADGRANWQFTPPDQAPQPGAAPVPTFDRLVVGGGAVSYNDEVIGLQMEVRARTDEGASSGGGGLGIEGEGRYREGVKRFAGAQFKFGITSEGLLPLVTPTEGAPPVPLTLQASAGKAKLDFKGQAKDILRLRGIEGDFSVSGPSLAAVGAPAGVTLPTTAHFEMKGRLSKDGDLYKARIARLAVGTSRLGGDFTYDRRPQVPLLSGELQGESLTLADLGPAFGAPPPDEERPRRAPDGHVLPAREFNIPSLRAMNADVRINLRKLDLGTGLLSDLTPLQGHITLKDGVLNISKLLARASGGEVRGDIGLDSRPAQPRWDIDLQWSGIDLERWIQARNQRAAAEGEKAPGYVSGVLGGEAKFRGVGKSTAAMLGSLDGHAALWVRRGQISHLVVEALGIDIAQALGVLIKGDESLPMHCAVTRFRAKDGVLDTELGVIDTPDTLVLVSGQLSLAKESLALRLNARPKDFSPLSLRSPIRLEGSFADPQVKLEGKSLGLKLLAAAALAAVNPLAAVIPMIDPGEGEDNGCRNALESLRGTTGAPAARKAPAPARR